MNNLGFRYAMGGASNLSRLAQDEQYRRYADWNQRRLESLSRSAMVGGLLGSVIGAGKGLYEDRKQQHDDAEREKVREWETQRERQRWENARYGREMDAGVTAPPKVNPYSVLDDIHRNFLDWGWID